METIGEQEKNPITKTNSSAVHQILAHSYFFYFALFLLGFFLDLIFRIRIFSNSVMTPLGFIFLFLGSVLVIWAQKASRILDRASEVKKETFCHGPYCFTRSPTHLGLFVLMLGFGILINAFFIVLFTIISFFVTRYVFLRKEESILEDKYGKPYLEYKKQVKF